jgi:hypothetical protein
VRKWADGQVEIHHEGAVLPYTLHDNYPFITPGDIVESKRIADAMAEIKAAQRDGVRKHAAAKRFALSGRCALPAAPKQKPSKPPTTDKVPESMVEPPANHYVIRWLGQDAHLYERVFRQQGPSEFAFTEEYLGPVEPRVAMRWEVRGNPLYPPPLVGATVPAVAAERVRDDGELGSTDGKSPLRLPRNVDGLSRLSAALWFADTFHAAEAQGIKDCIDVVDMLATQDLQARRRGPKSSRGAEENTPSRTDRQDEGLTQDAANDAIATQGT